MGIKKKRETNTERLYRLGAEVLNLGDSPHEVKTAIEEAKGLKFPLRFKVALRFLIGGRLYADRLHIFRKYWCYMLEEYARLGSVAPLGQDNRTDQGRQDMANIMIEKFGREGIEEEWYNRLKHSISEWRKINRTEQRRNAAKASWTRAARTKRKKKKK